MKQPDTGREPLNVKPSRLITDQDLLRDQLNYFHESSQHSHMSGSLQSIHRQLDNLSLLSRPTNPETPSSSFLEPIRERVVPKSSRRRSRSKSPSANPDPFPQPPMTTDLTATRFGRNPQLRQLQQTSPNQNSDSSISEQVRARVESMSIEQIREAQREIRDTLKPESIQVLNRMWHRKRQIIPNSETRTGNRHPPAPSPVKVNEQCSIQHPLSTGAHAELLVPIKSDESDEEERNKRVWMTDAEEPTPSQKEVDQVIEKALETLGDVGKLRFGLHGTVLSPEEIRALPTHLGLHHHGTSPASAGYTLPDIFVLMRSTVVSQRVMAMRMLKAIVVRHRDEVVAPLIESGTLTAGFSHLPVDESFFTAITNQICYVELIETLAEDDLLDNYDAVYELYFGSNYYSPCPVKDYNKVIMTLADSDVVTTLISIARATALRSEHVSIAQRALHLIRKLVTRAPGAARRVLQSKTYLLALKSLTATSPGCPPVVCLLCCEVLSHIAVSLGWQGGRVLEQLREDVLDDSFMHTLSSKLIWLLDSDIEEISVNLTATAKGVLRLIRAALVFQKGIESFAALVHFVCRLVRDEATATEAYLALEAYSHALFVEASSHQAEEIDRDLNGNVRSNEQHHQNESKLISRRLSDLIPNAISATTLFVDANVPLEETRAAAGHFAATLFALASQPVVEDHVVRILNVCSSSTDELAQLVAAFPKSIQRIRCLASVSHAAARLLCKVELEEGFVKREVQILIASADVERTVMERHSTLSAAHIVANTCADWIGLYSRVGPSKTTAELTLKLVPCLADVRVIVDLLSRTLLNVCVLRGLCSTISAETAEKCAKDLLPLVMTELPSLQQSRSEAGSASGSMYFEDICLLWVTRHDVYDSFFCIVTVFFESELFGGSPLFECLLRTPVTRYSESVFEFLFKVGQSCVYHGTPLITAKTSVSSLSTTVNSPIVDSVLSLCDFLLSRGPTPPTSVHNENPDFLSSILMTLMCGFDIDSTLRASMWKRTVDDCGGASLYQEAVVLEGERSSANTSSVLKLDDMLRLFGVSISQGYLDGERCPSVVKYTIIARIEAALTSGRAACDVFEVLASSVRSRSALSQRLVKLMMTVPFTSAKTEKLLSAFRDQDRFLS